MLFSYCDVGGVATPIILIIVASEINIEFGSERAKHFHFLLYLVSLSCSLTVGKYVDKYCVSCSILCGNAKEGERGQIKVN